MSPKERIADLRAAIGEPTADDAEVIASWEKGIKKLELARNWLAHPVTKAVYGEILVKAQKIAERLSTEGDMPEAERVGLFRDKKIYTWLLSLHHASNIDKTLEDLDAQIAQHADEFKAYRGNTQL